MYECMSECTIHTLPPIHTIYTLPPIHTIQAVRILRLEDSSIDDDTESNYNSYYDSFLNPFNGAMGASSSTTIDSQAHNTLRINIPMPSSIAYAFANIKDLIKPLRSGIIKSIRLVQVVIV